MWSLTKKPTMQLVIFLYPNGHIDQKFSATEMNRQGQLLMVEVSEDYRGHLGTVTRLEIKE